MGKERVRNRITCKVDQLPDEIKSEVDQMLLDTSITYLEISEYLKERDYEISKSAIGR